MRNRCPGFVPVDTSGAQGILPALMQSKPHVAVVGATGAVGIEMIKTLEKRNFPVGKLTLLASARSVGKKLKFRAGRSPSRSSPRTRFAGIDIALFSAGGGISKEFAPIAAKAGCVVVDNSSAFRMDDQVPLVVPEINAADVKQHKGIIANPNCTTAITLMALYPLHQAFGVKRIFASSYQAVSGTGAKAIENWTAGRADRQGPAGDQARSIRTRSRSMCCRMWIRSCRPATPRRR